MFLLRKIDGEINVQNGGFSLRNCEMKTVATCSTTDGNGSYHGIVFRRDDTLPTSKTLQATTRQPQWSIEIPQISRVPSAFTSVYVCAIATVVLRLTAATVATHPHRRMSKRLHIADVKT